MRVVPCRIVQSQEQEIGHVKTVMLFRMSPCARASKKSAFGLAMLRRNRIGVENASIILYGQLLLLMINILILILILIITNTNTNTDYNANNY